MLSHRPRSPTAESVTQRDGLIRATSWSEEERRSGHTVVCQTCMQQCSDVIGQIGSKYALSGGDFDDFSQDAWLAMLNALARDLYDPSRGRLTDWLYVVARNRAVTFFRRKWREQDARVEVPFELLECRGLETPDEALSRQCEIDRVQNAVASLRKRLSSTGFAVFHLRQIEQRDVQEVADLLSMTRESVRQYDFRARRKLAAILSCR